MAGGATIYMVLVLLHVGPEQKSALAHATILLLQKVETIVWVRLQYKLVVMKEHVQVRSIKCQFHSKCHLKDKNIFSIIESIS